MTSRPESRRPALVLIFIGNHLAQNQGVKDQKPRLILLTQTLILSLTVPLVGLGEMAAPDFRVLFAGYLAAPNVPVGPSSPVLGRCRLGACLDRNDALMMVDPAAGT